MAKMQIMYNNSIENENLLLYKQHDKHIFSII